MDSWPWSRVWRNRGFVGPGKGAGGLLHPAGEDHSPDLPRRDIELSVGDGLVPDIQVHAADADDITIHSVRADRSGVGGSE